MLFLIASFQVSAQSGSVLSIDSCYAKAQRNYPMVKQFGLIEKTKNYSLDNVSKGYFGSRNFGDVGYNGWVVHVCFKHCKGKEVGTIEQINVTPIRKHHFILGKLIPFWVIGMFVFTIGLFLVSRVVYGIVPAGSILVLYSFLAIYLLAVLGLGLIISTYSSTQQQAMSLAFFFMMIFILMGGLFTPVDSMPEWAKWIARINPVTYFIEVMRMVVMKGSGFSDIKNQLLIITGFAVFFNSWAIWNYKKTS